MGENSGECVLDFAPEKFYFMRNKYALQFLKAQTDFSNLKRFLKLDSRNPPPLNKHFQDASIFLLLVLSLQNNF